MYCNRCGNNLLAGSRFCNRCGEKNQSTGSGQHLNIPPPLTRPARLKVRFQDEQDEYKEEDLEFFDEEEEEENVYEAFDEEHDTDRRAGREKVIFSISPAMYGVASRYLVAIVFSIIVTALIALFAENIFSQVSFFLALGISTILMLNPIYHHIQHNRTLYILTSVRLEIQSGIFSKSSRNIPLRHIQDVTVNQSLSERLLGIGDVIIDSAVMEGTMPLSNIKDPRRYADLILSELQYWN